MALPFKAFTLKGSTSSLLKSLVTKCGVCLPFKPIPGAIQPKVYTFDALWDTGATGSVISKSVVSQLNLKPTSKTIAYHANGESIVNVYQVNIYLPNGVAFSMVNVTEGVLNGFDMIIGMDIIARGDFCITNFGGQTTFSFRYPSIKEIDFVKEADILSSRPTIGRKDPCHCGSGLMYKYCHGKGR